MNSTLNYARSVDSLDTLMGPEAAPLGVGHFTKLLVANRGVRFVLCWCFVVSYAFPFLSFISGDIWRICWTLYWIWILFIVV